MQHGIFLYIELKLGLYQQGSGLGSYNLVVVLIDLVQGSILCVFGCFFIVKDSEKLLALLLLLFSFINWSFSCGYFLANSSRKLGLMNILGF